MVKIFSKISSSLLVLLSGSILTAECLARDPVLMIPGMTSDGTSLIPMRDNLQSSGWPVQGLYIWTDSSKMTQDLAVAAQEISGKVDLVLAETGASKVVLVTWSASTLAARYYIKNLGGKTKVSQYIAFAGPQHGTTTNQCQAYVSCQQFGDANSPFLVNLNNRTEVPQSPPIKYLTLRSTGDLNVQPTDSAMLNGAQENFLMSGITAPNHFTIVSDGTALEKLKSFIKSNE